MNHLGMLSVLVVLIVLFARPVLREWSAMINAKELGQSGVATAMQAVIVVTLIYFLAKLLDSISKGI